MKKLSLVILLSLFHLSAWCATPYIACSDLTDGPTTGWEGSASQGAAVSIWGLNFGSSGSVVCGGQTISSASCVEWNATTNPTTARGLGRITFYLNSSMTTGGTAPNTSIKVITEDGTSNEIPFHCRAIGSNHIYFIKTDGNDSNNGLSVENAWLNLYKVRSVMVAGDVCYMKGGTYTTRDTQTGPTIYALLVLRTILSTPNYNNGEVWNTINISSYPGEVAQWGTGEDSETVGSINYAGSTPWSYWTISKIRGLPYSKFIYTEYDNATNSDHIRLIGCHINTVHSSAGQGIPINLYGDLSYWRVLCNYFPRCGQSEYWVFPFYLGGAGQSDHFYLGWNEFASSADNTFQFWAHLSTDTLSYLYIFNNYVHDGASGGTDAIGNGDSMGTNGFLDYVYIYNNIFDSNGIFQIQGTSQSSGAFSGHFYVYNNTFYGYGNRTFWMINATLCDVRNNIIYQPNGQPYTTDLNGYETYTEGSYNCWYGHGASGNPSWDSDTYSLDNTDPDMTDPANGDFSLSSSSDCIGAGNDLSALFSIDYMGKSRGAEYDIGAIEYAADEEEPATPTSTISGMTSCSGCSMQ